MKPSTLTTERLLLRPFQAGDEEAVFRIFSDRETNIFLPWFPLDAPEQAAGFMKERLFWPAGEDACFFAVCLKDSETPVGYVDLSGGEAHDFGYGLRSGLWHRGIISEAAAAVVGYLRAGGLPFITATHDVNNPRSGQVMKRLGMTYRYSYEEQWQPKDFPVIFRMYQLNLNGEYGTYRGYWNKYAKHFVESDV